MIGLFVIVVLMVAVIAAALGIGLGILIAGRMRVWLDRDEESDDG
jgi:hypothetical protein